MSSITINKLSLLLSVALLVPVTQCTLTQVLADPIPAMPVISRNCPAFASDNSNQAGKANDGSYNTVWRSGRQPSATAPCWIAYDLSVKHPKRVFVTWYNTGTYPYDHAIWNGGPAYGIPGSYTLEVNKGAGGGSPPIAGWVNVLSVTGNTYHSRSHLIDMTGSNWLRMSVTATDGTAFNYDPTINLDVHDARHGIVDSWLFLGDSITAGGMTQENTNFSTIVHNANPSFFPSQENGGEGGFHTWDALSFIEIWLANFPGHFVTLCYGTNDVNTSPGDIRVVNTAIANLKYLADKVIAAGKVPIIPHIPWARTAGIESNGPILNARIDQLVASDPRIVAGPDLFAYYQENQDLIGQDNLHPTNPVGFQHYRSLWAEWALTHIYK